MTLTVAQIERISRAQTKRMQSALSRVAKTLEHTHYPPETQTALAELAISRAKGPTEYEHATRAIKWLKTHGHL